MAYGALALLTPHIRRENGSASPIVHIPREGWGLSSDMLDIRALVRGEEEVFIKKPLRLWKRSMSTTSIPLC
jgi:hypothetical protein